MALSRRKWNNIIMLSCIVMIASLSFLDERQQDTSQPQPLFSTELPLTQLQYNQHWFTANEQYQCDEFVTDCLSWINAWQQLQVSPITLSQPPLESPQEISFTIANQDSQIWLLYAHKGMLKSSSGNWYLIPPSLRHDLLPKIR